VVFHQHSSLTLSTNICNWCACTTVPSQIRVRFCIYMFALSIVPFLFYILLLVLFCYDWFILDIRNTGIVIFYYIN